MNLRQAILATLAYHDIFDYPMTKEETCRYLIEERANLKSIRDGLNYLVASKKIGAKEGYYFLKNRTNLVSLRIQRGKYSKSKFTKAHFFANILKIIPTAKLVAVSGALAMQNSQKDDDIDLVIVTAKDYLWTTRFLANIVLLPFKRNPSGVKISDRACLNVFIDESDLKIKPANFYQAHEICQMKVLWDRESTYQKFLKANSWIKKYLPNWQPSSQFTVHSSRKLKPSTVNRQPSTVENFLKNFQRWYMRSKITNEKIGEHQLFFHPKDTQELVLREYAKRLKLLKLPSADL